MSARAGLRNLSVPLPAWSMRLPLSPRIASRTTLDDDPLYRVCAGW